MTEASRGAPGTLRYPGKPMPMPDSTVTLSIIIVSWNTRDLLAACLQSVYDTVRDQAFDLFVVDNASIDGSATMVREQFPAVKLIENDENVGFARANNQAIAQAQGRYVLLLNSDTVIRGDAVATLIADLTANPRCCAVGPHLLNADGTTQPSCYPVLTPFREFWRLSFLDRLVPLARYRFDMDRGGQPHPVQVLKGACILLRREALDEVGRFDEGYFMYTEEMDLFLRLLRAGWTVRWVPDAHVVHLGGQSTSQVAEAMYLELYRSKVRFQRKFYGEAGAKVGRSLIALAYLPRYAWSRLSGADDRARLYRRLLTELPCL